MKPDATYLQDAYRFHWAAHNVEAVLERFVEDRRGGLTAEVKLSTGQPPNPGLLTRTRLNLSSSKARKDLSKVLAERLEGLDWYGMLEQMCFLATDRYRDGEPVIDLSCVPPRAGTRWLVEPFVELGQPTVLFAEGGTGKSTFALALALSVVTGEAILSDREPSERGPVLYLDWESDEFTHAERWRALCAGLGLRQVPRLHYRRQTASLAESAAQVRKEIAASGAKLVIVDSLGMARGAEPESAEVTIRMFAALRTFQVAAACIDHVAKNKDNRDHPFGSIYTVNAARLVWSMAKSQEEDEGQFVLAVKNTKSNNGMLHRKRGFRITWRNSEEGEAESVTIQPTDLLKVQKFRTQAPQHLQIREILRANNRPMVVDDIRDALEADGVEVTAAHVRALLNKYDTFVRLPGGEPAQWALRADQPERGAAFVARNYPTLRA